MVQQCAWCLRLINSMGEHISPVPVPKIYEASHGMCQACGRRWLAAAEESYRERGTVAISGLENGRHHVHCVQEGDHKGWEGEHKGRPYYGR